MTTRPSLSVSVVIAWPTDSGGVGRDPPVGWRVVEGVAGSKQWAGMAGGPMGVDGKGHPSVLIRGSLGRAHTLQVLPWEPVSEVAGGRAVADGGSGVAVEELGGCSKACPEQAVARAR